MSSLNPRWLLKQAVIAMHDELIALHGGSSGIRDDGLLESALARPMNVYSYNNEATIFDLAASYGEGLCKNHAFVDGNKRIALVATAVFLRLNGHQLIAPEAAAATLFEELAAGNVDNDTLCAWLKANSKPLGSG